MSYTQGTYETFYLQDWDQDFMDLHLEVEKAKEDAAKKGWINLTIHLVSTRESYEDDWLGTPELILEGDRPMTEKEELEAAAQEIVKQYAKDKGISIYDASIVMKLKKAGKIL